MNIAFIGFLAFCFVGMTLINRVLEGAFITAGDMSVFNNLTIFRDMQIFGTFSIPTPNIAFITEGLPRLVKWDLSYFGGSGAFFQYFFYSLTAAMAFGLFVLMISAAIYSFNRTR
jgi:hypothetical protein